MTVKRSNTPIRQANRRARLKFLLTLLLSLLAGYVSVYCAAAFTREDVSTGLGQAGKLFSLSIAPWLLLACAVLQLLTCVPPYLRAKQHLARWDSADEAGLDQAENTLEMLVWIAGLFSIVSMFLLGAALTAPALAGSEGVSPALLLVGIASFLLSYLTGMQIQRRALELILPLHPERQVVSIYDSRFQEKWYDNSDEAEKLIVGRCAYKAHSAVNKTCLFLWLVCTISAWLLGTGLLPILAVCLIWGTGQIAYSYWNIRLDQPGGLSI